VARYELYGLGSDRLPPRYASYTSYKFPATVTVPEAFGKGGSLAVKDLFSAAFEELQECAGRSRCDRHFRLLGEGLGLSDILADWRFFFFAFGPEGEHGAWPKHDRGVTFAQVVGKYPETRFAEVGIHITALRSAAFLAATLLHEFAHIAGAPGASDDDHALHAAGKLPRKKLNQLHLAEEAVLVCGLRQHYKKDVIGAIDLIKRAREAEPKRIA
jgi:hypothetical protein